MKLETKRLLLRPPTKKDVNDLIEGLNNINVSKHLAKVGYPYTKKDALMWIKYFQKKEKEKKDYIFEIELKEEKKLIGACGLHDYDKFNQSIEMGYWLNEKYWRRGIMTEVCMKAIDFAFKELKVNRVHLSAFVENTASNSLAKKLGFTREGMLRNSNKAKSTGKLHDTNIYGLLKKEWPKNKKRLLAEMKRK